MEVYFGEASELLQASHSRAKCLCRNIPTEKLDVVVLEQLASHVYALQRLQLILTETRTVSCTKRMPIG